MALSARVRIVIGFATIFSVLAALIWFLSVKFQAQPVTPVAPPTARDEPPSAPNAPPTPLTAPSPIAPPAGAPPPGPDQPELTNPPGTSSSPATSPSAPPATPPGAAGLIIPVAGVRPDQLRDTFNEARSEGRAHDAIDIPAARGTPVLATADGRVIKLFYSDRGGITIYQLGTDSRTSYYYAHLERYADGLSEGHVARQGEVIGYVGDTGNATPGNYHLHFSVSVVSDPKRHWEGVNINPYPLLVR